VPEPNEKRIIKPFPYYYDLYLPDGDRPRPLIIATHGYGGDKASMMKLARRINDGDYVIASLQGPHQHLVMPTKESPQLGYGFGWLSNFKPQESVALHHQLVLDIIESLKSSGKIDPRRIFLLGFSQSVGVNFRFAFTHAGLVRGVIAICGGIPGDWDKDDQYESGEIDVLYIAAERDEFYTPERMRQNAEALKRRAGSVELRFFDAGHEVPRGSDAVINQWLESKTKDERQ
jgi:predicted esterase